MCDRSVQQVVIGKGGFVYYRRGSYENVRREGTNTAKGAEYGYSDRDLSVRSLYCLAH